MTRISEASHSAIHELMKRMEIELAKCDCLENAAQKFTDSFYQEYEESIVLIRLFATAPFGNLPLPNQTFVSKLLSSHLSSRIENQDLDPIPVLSLLGTHGNNAEWNDRRNSTGHVGIPLISSDFIQEIPMMSRLLKELGLNLDWIDSNDTEIVTKAIGKMGGVFYVPDAHTAVDQKGRKIISAQDFVEANNIKTVFGLGGGYMIGDANAAFITIIIFTNEDIDKSQAEKFLTVINSFKTITVRLAIENKIFSE